MPVFDELAVAGPLPAPISSVAAVRNNAFLLGGGIIHHSGIGRSDLVCSGLVIRTVSSFGFAYQDWTSELKRKVVCYTAPSTWVFQRETGRTPTGSVNEWAVREARADAREVTIDAGDHLSSLSLLRLRNAA